jgi:hypothetical protein
MGLQDRLFIALAVFAMLGASPLVAVLVLPRCASDVADDDRAPTAYERWMSVLFSLFYAAGLYG